MKKTIIVLLALSTVLNGCIGAIPVGEEEENDNVPIQEPDGVLDILTYDASGLSEELLADFTAKTGYDVNLVKAGDAGSVLNTMAQTKSAPQADLMLGLDNTYLGQALEMGLLQTHMSNHGDLIESVTIPYQGGFATPFDHGYVCLNYDSSVVDGVNMSVPTSLWDLTEDEWKGKVAIPSPLSSSPGRSFLAATVDYFAHDADNQTDYSDWWYEMTGNDLIITSGWSEAYETHYSGGYGPWTDGHIGDANIVVSYCHSPGVEAFFGGNYTNSETLDLPRASFHQVEYAGIIAGAGDAQAAAAFIDYLLSEEVNANMPTQNYMYSVLNGQDLPETNGYRHHSVIPQQPADLSPEDIASGMEQWLIEWSYATA